MDKVGFWSLGIAGTSFIVLGFFKYSGKLMQISVANSYSSLPELKNEVKVSFFPSSSLKHKRNTSRNTQTPMKEFIAKYLANLRRTVNHTLLQFANSKPKIVNFF